MDEIRKTGRVTIPTDLDVVPETLEILKKSGVPMPSATATAPTFRNSSRMRTPRSTPPTIPPARITHGQKQTRTRCSSATS
mgnify:CR=1 FL=1